MTRPASTRRLRPAQPASLPEEPVAPSDDDGSRVAARPDGFYWVADDGHQEFGPFATAAEALAAMHSGIDSGLESDETLQQVEDEIGFTETPPTEEGTRRE